MKQSNEKPPSRRNLVSVTAANQPQIASISTIDFGAQLNGLAAAQGRGDKTSRQSAGKGNTISANGKSSPSQKSASQRQQSSNDPGRSPPLKPFNNKTVLPAVKSQGIIGTLQIQSRSIASGIPKLSTAPPIATADNSQTEQKAVQSSAIVSSGKDSALIPVVATQTVGMSPLSTPRNVGPITPRKLPPSEQLNKPVSPQGTPTRIKKTSITSKPVLPNINDDRRILTGHLEHLPKAKSSVVRVFLSSTFADFKIERDALYQYAYPELKKFCSELELDFQVADLRWGIPEDAGNDHMIEKLCMDEVKRCQRISLGPYFVAMVGNRYGYRPAAPRINATEFELIRANANEQFDKNDASILDIWYKKDMNAYWPIYVLQPIDSILPHYTHVSPENAELRNTAIQEWKIVEIKICTVLRRCAMSLAKAGKLDAQTAHRYMWSVTEQEIDAGIFQSGYANTTCICLMRNLTGVYDDKQNPLVARFTDLNNKLVDEEAQSLLQELKNSKLTTHLTNTTLKDFTIPWLEKGIDTTNSKHREYIDVFVQSFVGIIKQLVSDTMKADKPLKQSKPTKQQNEPSNISKNINNSHNNNNNKKTDVDTRISMMKQFHLGKQALLQLQDDNKRLEAGEIPAEHVKKSREELDDEILHHLLLCRDKCELFCGREKELSVVKQYLAGTGKVSPLIVHAPSGQGKTSFMAKIASSVKQWCGDDTPVVIRFLGTSPTSSTLRDCLMSVNEQFVAICNDIIPAFDTSKCSRVVQMFNRLLSVASWSQVSSKVSLVLLLDSLDQLSKDNEPYSLTWLPKVLPERVFVIVSVLTDAEECLANAHNRISNKNSFLDLPLLEQSVLESFCKSFLNVHNRRLTEFQLQFLVNKVSENRSPMFINLSLETSLSWKSYSTVEELVLADTLIEAIGTLFANCEKKHGTMFVRLALGYFSSGLYGLTDIELEDVMSCNDQLLNETYKFHNPPQEGVIRIPPLLWLRLKHDLHAYIVERRAENVVIMAWYHRQFWQAAKTRYCNDNGKATLHTDLAELFLAEKAIKRTISLKYRNIIINDADRRITVQKLEPSNRRKLHCILHHLLESRDLEKLTRHVVCNLNYIKSYFAAYSVSQFLIVLTRIIDSFANESNETAKFYISEVNLLYSILKFSQSCLSDDPLSLEVQLVGQLLPYVDSTSRKNSPLVALREEAQLYCVHNEATALLPVAGILPTSLSNLKWYKVDVKYILYVTSSADRALIVCAGDNDIWLLNTGTLDIGLNLNIPRRFLQDEVLSGTINSTCSKIYLLFKERFLVFSASNGSLLQTCSTEVRQGGHLNSNMAVTANGHLLLLAGKCRLGLLEDKNNSSEESNLEINQAVNLSGALSTIDVMLTQAEKHSISTHVLQGKDKRLGAIVLWDFELHQIKTKVLLPSEPRRKMLFNMPSQSDRAIILCACMAGEAVIIDILAGTITTQFTYCSENDPISSIQALFSGSTLCVAKFGENSSHLSMWNVDVTLCEQTNQYDVNKPNITIMTVVGDGSNIVLGDNNGNLVIVSAATGTVKSTVRAHDDLIKGVFSTTDDKLFTLGKDEMLKQWDMDEIEKAHSTADTQQATETHDRFQNDQVSALSFSSDSLKIATAAFSWLRIWSFIDDKWKILNEKNIGDIKLSLLSFVISNTWLMGYDQERNKMLYFTENINDSVADELNEEFDSSVLYFAINSSATETVVLRRINGSEDILMSFIDLQTTKPHFDKSRNTVVKLKNKITEVIQCIFCKDDVIVMTKCDILSDGYSSFVVNRALSEPIWFRMHNSKSMENTSVVKIQPIFSVCQFKDSSTLMGCRGIACEWSLADSAETSAEQCYNHSDFVSLYYTKRSNAESNTGRCITALKVRNNVILTGSEDGTVVCWMQSEGSNGGFSTKILSRHKHMVTCFDISVNGYLAVSGSRDRTVKLHNISAGNELACIHIHLPIVTLSFSSTDANHIAVRAKDLDNSVFVLLRPVNIST